MDAMFTLSKPILSIMALALLGVSVQKDGNIPSSPGLEYTSDGQLKLPEQYRHWVFLSSDYYPLSSSAGMQNGGHSKFNNIFVNPEAYDAFLQTGTWPDKTVLVVEVRDAEEVSGNNQKGIVQSSGLGLAVHLKDETRFPGQWAFFGFHGEKTARMIPETANCYSCHAAHGAADTTFVQFYPTLLPAAKSKDTLTPEFKQEIEGTAPSAK
jgi:hypothetical protein